MPQFRREMKSFVLVMMLNAYNVIFLHKKGVKRRVRRELGEYMKTTIRICVKMRI